MPTREQIAGAVDDRVAELMAWIAAQQDAYLASHGRYASLGWSHSEDPQDGVSTPADRLDFQLPHQSETWTNFGYPIQEPVANAAVDEYLMPDGQRGWILKLSLSMGGATWRKSIDSGSGEFGFEWRKVTVL
jgi:hypothetical protein